jgi:CheY-like chemotaxis protein
MRDVLIADDDAALRQALKLGLEAAGYRVQLAANGREALALQRTRPADVLVTDLFMPESDGFVAISGFRQAFPSTAIIAMSGGAQRARGDYLAAATLAGVDATLRKPFPMQALLQAIRSLEQPR